jgi:uncharacterized coiled-coil DUF342 family protein
MANAAAAARVEFDAIERLEDKVRKLVGVVEQLRAEHGRLTAAEITALRDERDQVRARVTDMLAQLDALDV